MEAVSSATLEAPLVANLVPSIVYLKLSKYDGKKLVTSATTPDANQVKADDVLITSGASAKGSCNLHQAV
mgnify:CR=1 FL=1